MKKNAFMKKLAKVEGVTVHGTSEDFSGSKGGIWLSGSAFNMNAWEFDPQEEAYTMGVRNDIADLGHDHGWFFEFNDPETVMAWES
jgi:hypothetical protein